MRSKNHRIRNKKNIFMEKTLSKKRESYVVLEFFSKSRTTNISQNHRLINAWNYISCCQKVRKIQYTCLFNIFLKND